MGGRRPGADHADSAGRQAIDGAALARFAEETAAAAERPAPRPVVSESARNRFLGLVTKVTRDTVMAQVEIQAGPHRIVSLMSREAADELGLGARRARRRSREVHQRRRRGPRATRTGRLTASPATEE